MGRRGRRLVSFVAACAIVLPACGRGSAPVVAPPKRVPVAIVPDRIDVGGENGAFTFEEYSAARKQFARAGVHSMVADGRLWQIRRGSTLVGTLQISTVKPKVDLAGEVDRNRMTDLITQGGATTIKVRGIEVISTSEAQKTSYLWYGKQLFEYLQVKGNDLKPEPILRAILVFQKKTGELDVPATGSS